MPIGRETEKKIPSSPSGIEWPTEEEKDGDPDMCYRDKHGRYTN